MPNIKLRLKGQLAERLEGGQTEYEVPQGKTLGSFLADHDLEARHYVLVLNNTVAPSRTSVLNDGDSITVYPQMAGG